MYKKPLQQKRSKLEQGEIPSKIWQGLVAAAKKRDVTTKRDFNKEQIARTLNKWR